MIFQGLVGQSNIISPTQGNATLPARLGKQGDLIITNLHGRYYETAYNKNMFCAASTATTWSTALGSSYQGLVLSNPAGNTKNLVPTKIGIDNATGACYAGLIGGYSPQGITVHTTPLITSSTFLGVGPSATGKVDGAATLVGTPTWLMLLVGKSSLTPMIPGFVDLEGSLIIPPGAYIAILFGYSNGNNASIFWEENTI